MMIESLIQLKLPFQKPQVVRLKRFGPALFRLGLFDRYDRVEWLQGELVGFGIIVFHTYRSPKVLRLVLRDDFSEALYRNFEGQTVEIDVKLVGSIND
jgi:hypothetical protein